MIKPYGVVISSSGSIQQLLLSSAPTLAPISSPGRTQRKPIHIERSNSTRRTRTQAQQVRCLFCRASLVRPIQRRRAHTSPPEENPDLYWPDLPPTKQPTPYDILSHPISGPYKKRRFNHLVKLYHPDSPSPTPAPTGHPCTLPPATRLKRYHLLIQAHTLLSTPHLKEAYDRHGAGWASTPSIEDLSRENSSRGWAAAQDYRKQTPKHCATWEDWEEWWSSEARRQAKDDEGIFHHDFTRPRPSPQERAEAQAWYVAWLHEQSRWRPGGNPREGFYSPNIPRQEPLYTSNALFILLVATCGMGGVFYEVSRAGRNSATLLAKMEERNLNSFRELNKSRMESKSLDSRGERVGRFLKERGEDAVLGGRVREKEIEEARQGSAQGINT